MTYFTWTFATLTFVFQTKCFFFVSDFTAKKKAFNLCRFPKNWCSFMTIENLYSNTGKPDSFHFGYTEQHLFALTTFRLYLRLKVSCWLNWDKKWIIFMLQLPCGGANPNCSWQALISRSYKRRANTSRSYKRRSNTATKWE